MKKTFYIGQKPNQQRLVEPSREELDKALIADCERAIARLEQFKKALDEYEQARSDGEKWCK